LGQGKLGVAKIGGESKRLITKVPSAGPSGGPNVIGLLFKKGGGKDGIVESVVLWSGPLLGRKEGGTGD